MSDSESRNVGEEEQAPPKLPTHGEAGENPNLEEEVSLDNPLKEWFVNYVGEKYKPEDGVVTVSLALQAFAEEFPEFLMVLAEENWIRGYQQGVHDSEEGVRMALEEAGVEAKIVVPPNLKDAVANAPSEIDVPPEVIAALSDEDE